MTTVMDDLIIVAMMLARLGIPILMLALLSALAHRVARSSA